MSFRLYRVSSTRNGVWIAAPNAESAKVLFVKYGYAKFERSIKNCVDQTDFYLDPNNSGGTSPAFRQQTADSLKSILDKETCGTLAIRLGGCMTGPQFLGMAPKPKEEPNRWEFVAF